MEDMGLTRGTTGRILVISTEESAQAHTINVAKAIASQPRLRILEYLISKVASVSEISDALDMPIATASLHLNNLEEARLVSSQTAPGKRGQQRLYTRTYDSVVFHLPEAKHRSAKNNFTIQMPVGAFVNHHVVPTCGLAGANGVLGILDDPISFYEPERFHAQLVWFSHGYLEYQFPNHIFEREHPASLQLSMEICSEAAPSAEDWPSDIFLDVNHQRVGIWTSPADFGDTRGILTPDWWPDWSSQYGWLKLWRIDKHGSFVDGRKISSVTINDLNLPDEPYISVRIGIHDDAENKGGLNLFGKQFGNHAQDIIMQIHY